MTVGERVRHASRPDLGVGTIRAEIKPDVVEVAWEKRTASGRRVWGHYRTTNLLPADRRDTEEAPAT